MRSDRRTESPFCAPHCARRTASPDGASMGDPGNRIGICALRVCFAGGHRRSTSRRKKDRPEAERNLRGAYGASHACGKTAWCRCTVRATSSDFAWPRRPLNRRRPGCPGRRRAAVTGRCRPGRPRRRCYRPLRSRTPRRHPRRPSACRPAGTLRRRRRTGPTGGWR